MFDVMHHGTHEKQLSNVFGWLLDIGGSHDLHDRFLRIFIDEVNVASADLAPFPHGNYRVRQEVNTATVIGRDDIADLVLETDYASLVVENYFTSDGHGHGYERYLEFSRRDGRRGAVVLLCREEDRSRQSHGWENARVVTYSRLIDRLHDVLDADVHYQQTNPDSYSFINQMHRKFVSERGLVGDRELLRFMTAMCDTGEAERYRIRRQDEAAEQFASDLAVQARERYVEGRELLQRVKSRLRTFVDGPLVDQLRDTLGDDCIRKVSATYAGIYQWTINFDIAGTTADSGGSHIQLKFGPTAWFANERTPAWRSTVDPEVADYSHVFITHVDALMIRQTTVTLEEVLDGLDSSDRRLHDEIIGLLNPCLRG
ncbi:PD-(D/E)XK nuclease family protein [Kocuria coralli]|uniref:PD-(D/E)XK nuclease family protein n=1 Tax=Kocuria coralli TaxID=1461025 RepID=UPI0015F2BCD1|nr:PD-(D/E)XK nuclease family protein [Kocuria coralli]